MLWSISTKTRAFIRENLPPPPSDDVSSSLIPAGDRIVTLRFLTGLFVMVNIEDFLGASCLFSTTSITLGCFLVVSFEISFLGEFFGSSASSSSLSEI